ncbi:hypothetical protein KAI46_10145 [bacterium]|nr:hypothetical protein [bacterium]
MPIGTLIINQAKALNPDPVPSPRKEVSQAETPATLILYTAQNLPDTWSRPDNKVGQ